METLTWQPPAWGPLQWGAARWSSFGSSWPREAARPKSVFKVEGPVTVTGVDSTERGFLFGPAFSISTLAGKPLMTVLSWGRQGSLTSGSGTSLLGVGLARGDNAGIWSMLTPFSSLQGAAVGGQCVMWSRFVAPSSVYMAQGSGNYVSGSYGGINGTAPLYNDISAVLPDGLESEARFCLIMRDTRTAGDMGDITISGLEVFAHDFV